MTKIEEIVEIDNAEIKKAEATKKRQEMLESLNSRKSLYAQHNQISKGKTNNSKVFMRRSNGK